MAIIVIIVILMAIAAIFKDQLEKMIDKVFLNLGNFIDKGL